MSNTPDPISYLRALLICAENRTLPSIHIFEYFLDDSLSIVWKLIGGEPIYRKSPYGRINLPSPFGLRAARSEIERLNKIINMFGYRIHEMSRGSARQLFHAGSLKGIDNWMVTSASARGLSNRILCSLSSDSRPEPHLKSLLHVYTPGTQILIELVRIPDVE